MINKGLEVNKEQYNQILLAQYDNKSDVREHIFGSRKRLYKNDFLLATYCSSNSLDLGNLDTKVFHRFLAHFNKQFYKQLINNQSLISLNIQHNQQSREKNLKNWESLPVGSYFYSIDVKNAYWQIAHKIGYINSNFFEKYLHNDDYKQAKRYCISFLARTNKSSYLSNQKTNTITCNMDLFNQAYTNIRNLLYKIIFECVESTQNNYLEYNIDGLYVLNTEVRGIKNILKSHGIMSKLIECVKVNGTQYAMQNKLRNFTHNHTQNKHEQNKHYQGIHIQQ
jgi:hypothetical protein